MDENCLPKADSSSGGSNGTTTGTTTTDNTGGSSTATTGSNTSSSTGFGLPSFITRVDLNNNGIPDIFEGHTATNDPASDGDNGSDDNGSGDNGSGSNMNEVFTYDPAGQGTCTRGFDTVVRNTIFTEVFAVVQNTETVNKDVCCMQGDLMTDANLLMACITTLAEENEVFTWDPAGQGTCTR